MTGEVMITPVLRGQENRLASTHDAESRPDSLERSPKSMAIAHTPELSQHTGDSIYFLLFSNYRTRYESYEVPI